ncbi:alpha/beta hydrolase family esterase [Actinoplanes teichomyceticus]|uniref:alpha/beta hydrolase family esterase n=1 Tax=Actinoplanes teichomyceticus TaxID=1867 RepID=UPI000F09B1C2|nr:PHB depolymerase family esterase [Actinoplanes teichomyceticus]
MTATGPRRRSRRTGQARLRTVGALVVAVTLLAGCQESAPSAGQDPASAAGSAAPAASPGPSPRRVSPVALTRADGELSIGGVRRTYRLFRPPQERYPVVVALHGKQSSGAEMERATGLRSWAARRGMAVVYPEGRHGAWGDGWRPTRLRPDPDADVAFLTALAGHLADRHGADPGRIFLLGVSNGGNMALRAAVQAPDRFHAVASVAGQLPVAPSAPAARGGIPTLLIYGTDDPLRPYSGLATPPPAAARFEEPPTPTIGAEETARAFAAGAGDGVREWLPDVDQRDGTRVRRTSWRARPEGGPVLLYTVRGGGHTWPASRGDQPRALGATSQDIDASDLITRFFADLP